MDVVLNNLVGAEYWVLIDDVIIFSNTLCAWKIYYVGLMESNYNCTQANVSLPNLRCST